MRAVRIHQTGGPEVLTIDEVPEPTPGDGEIVIRPEAIGLNFVDVYFRRGDIPKPTPFISGQEAAGVVEAVGSGVTDIKVGDRVASNAVAGAYADLVVAPAARTVVVPDGVSFEAAATVMVQGLTAHYLANSTFPLGPNHTALVHSGAGGVGLLLTQMAKMRGAHVISTVSTEEKAELSTQAGADEVINYAKVDFKDEVRRVFPDGIDVVYDAVGRDTFEQSLGCLRPLGMMVLYGDSSGPVTFNPRHLTKFGSAFLTGPSGGHYMLETSQLRERSAEVFQWIEDGRLEIRIGEVHPLADAVEAQRRLESRLTTGKVLLKP